MSDEMQGYRQQPGKLPFAKPGSGGSEPFSKLRDMESNKDSLATINKGRTKNIRTKTTVKVTERNTIKTTMP